jgi:hypothetical protein
MIDPTIAEIHAADAERPKVHALRAMVGHDLPPHIRLRVGDDDVELPPSLVRALLAAVRSLDEGGSIAIVREEAEVSPARAARLLGVSRQYVDRLLAADVLPARRLPNSRYRRIPMRAILDHEKARERKREGIRKIVDDAVDSGLKY